MAWSLPDARPHTPAAFRLRLSSIEPWDLTPAFFALWQDPRLCRHLHLPLQSGSDRVLAAMRRGYSRDDYLRLVTEARRMVPGVALTTDLIVGFPGETAAEFEETLATIGRVGFSGAFSFKYSPRPGTRAAALEEYKLLKRLQAETAEKLFNQIYR